MTNKARAPITQEERLAIRQRRIDGHEADQIAKEFSCSIRTVNSLCVGLGPRSGERKPPITKEQIDEIVRLKREGLFVPDIARILGLSPTTITRYTPRHLKFSRAIKSGGLTETAKAEAFHEKVVLARMESPPPRKKPVADEIPDAVLRMTESFRARGMMPAAARAEAIRIYAKTKR